MEKNVAVYATQDGFKFNNSELHTAIEWYLSLPSSRRKMVDKLRKLITRTTGQYNTDALVLVYQLSINR